MIFCCFNSSALYFFILLFHLSFQVFFHSLLFPLLHFSLYIQWHFSDRRVSLHQLFILIQTEISKMSSSFSFLFHFSGHMSFFFLKSQYLNQLLLFLLTPPFLLSIIFRFSSRYFHLRLLKSCILHCSLLHFFIMSLHRLFYHLRCSCHVRSDSTVNKTPLTQKVSKTSQKWKHTLKKRKNDSLLPSMMEYYSQLAIWAHLLVGTLPFVI